MRHPLLTTVLLFSSALCLAADRVLKGVVVRTDPDKLYFDLGRDSGIARGARFEVQRRGEELKHPVSGESLGRIMETVAKGTVTDVQEKYSIGEVTDSPGKPAIADKVRILPPKTRAAPLPAAQAEGTRVPGNRSPLLDMEAVDIAVGDVDGDGAVEIVIADTDSVLALKPWPEGGSWDPVCSFDNDATGAHFKSLETVDLDGDGRAEVFATLHNKLFKQMETYVLDCAGGILKKRETLAGMVRSYDTAGEGRKLAVQEIEDRLSFPAGRVHALEYRDGKYRRAKRSIKHKRLDWAYSFGFAEADGEPVLVSYNHAQRLSVRFRKRAWTSRETYGQTSQRVRWGETLLRFHPKFYLEKGSKGLHGIYTLKNIPGLFGLSASFGRFKNSELHRLEWTGLSFEPGWKAELGGYAAGLAKVPASSGRPEHLLVAVVGANGKTSVWSFDK